MKSHFFVRLQVLTDGSKLYEVTFFDGGDGNTDTVVYSHISSVYADIKCDRLNEALQDKQ